MIERAVVIRKCIIRVFYVSDINLLSGFVSYCGPNREHPKIL